MPAELRARLLQRIHENLDDDLARSVYADHLLELGGGDAWHGNLIRLQLDGVAPEKIPKRLRDHQTRALGQLVHLYDVTWTRGFPERLRTRKWTREHGERVLRSEHLPTIQAIEIGHMYTGMLDKLLAAPQALTSRITELNICGLTPARFDKLLAAAAQFPRVRRLGLALEPMLQGSANQLRFPALRLLFESELGPQLELVQSAFTAQLGRYIAELERAPATLRQLDLLQVNEAGDAEAATVLMRSANGDFEVSRDPLVPMIAMLRADGDGGFESETQAWPAEQLRELGVRLAREGLDTEARTVTDVARRRGAVDG